MCKNPLLAFCLAALTGCAHAAPVSSGDPFHARPGGSVELEHGVKFRFVGVTKDERCPVDVTCVWQGEAFLEIELQAEGQRARETITTVNSDRTLLAHRVKLLNLVPPPRSGERRDPKEYVAFFRIAAAPPPHTRCRRGYARLQRDVARRREADRLHHAWCAAVSRAQ